MAVEGVETVVDVVPAAAERNLLAQETVPMTVLAQDPSITDDGGPIRVALPVPAGRLAHGPCSDRFRVVSPAGVPLPVGLHVGDPWVYADRWSPTAQPDAHALPEDPDFRAQNVFAVAAHTLALFEQRLGRPVPWRSGLPQLDLVPQAAPGKANAFYSRERNAVLFGWLPLLPSRPALYTALSYDVIAHEVSHAVLDGLRPRFTQPGPPDQLAFHEALADLVALLSVFTVPGVALRLLAATDGEASHPGSAALAPSELARRRVAETAASLAALGVEPAGSVRLRLPDSALTSVEERLTAAVTAAAQRVDVVLAPWSGDAHPDHEALGRAACAAAAAHGVPVLAFPVWTWHWSRPGDPRVPWHRARVVRLSPAVRAARRDAVACFATQVRPVGPAPEDAAVLPPEVLEHFDRDVEVVFA